MIQSEELLWAWAAGIVDGEGCIRITKNVQHRLPYYALTVSVSMTHRSTVERLKQVIGCSSNLSLDAHGGKKVMHAMKCNGHEAHYALKRLLPYLHTKKDQAVLGIEFYEKCCGNYKAIGVPEDIQILRAVMYQEMKDLK